MIRRNSLKLIVAAAVVVSLSGCYGAKLVKGPINSENASMQADSLRNENQRMLRLLTSLQQELDQEREARLRYQADNAVRLDEIDQSLRILISRFEDSEQRAERQVVARPEPRRYVAPDTASNDSTVVPPETRAGGTADELFRAAYLDLTRGSLSLAAQGFQNYLVRYPTGQHLPEVHYYLGECYYAGDRFLEAVAEYQYVVREFPSSRMVPASYLKTGRCYLQLEEKYLAEKAFRTLVEDYPTTEEARQAEAELRQLEG